VALREKERSEKTIFHRLVQKGVHITWNNQFTEAEAEFSRYSSFCPRHLLHLGEVSMVKQAITGKLKDKELTMKVLQQVEGMVLAILNDPRELVRL